ncbi:hypothetical protein [Flavobacterium sp. KACC 22763]|uniref:hypothetical protein n=1 Tax=Flavobacterium sp. KACC 22763 TaxID=3025668 RepID=UPI002365558E|nr:hypothetical protein [Flavobacterium sp. KACC 22763]WDF65967.1 hypothetical protein PQ463_07290 [Flavobacterium sp. KACC 22763]
MKAKNNLIGAVLCVFLLTACSKRILTDNPEPEATLYEINHKEDVSLVFFDHNQDDGLEKHLSIYQRFAEAFDTIQDVHVFHVSENCVIEFRNYGYYYFNNHDDKIKSGMILSNGVDKPILVTNADKYIETYESYFKVPFNDKVYYGKLRKAEIAERQKESEKELKSKFKVDQNYADNLIKNSNVSYYPKTNAFLSCSTGKVTAKAFKDNAKNAKSFMQIETLYDKNGLIKQYSTIINGVLYSEDLYYRNSHHLIDSIVRKNEKGEKSKDVFKYGKKQFSIISVDQKNVMIAKVFHLNDKFQCAKSETVNGSGDVVAITFFEYDEFGRIVKEINSTQKLVYEYKNNQEVFYSKMKIYSIKDNALLSENIRYSEGKKDTFISKEGNKILSKTVSSNNPNGCTKTVYNYNSDNKLSELYEYSYEN